MSCICTADSIKCRLQIGYKCRLTPKPSVKNTTNFRFLTYGNVTQSPFPRSAKSVGFLWFDLLVFIWCSRFSMADRKYWIRNCLASCILWLKCFIYSIQRVLLGRLITLGGSAHVIGVLNFTGAFQSFTRFVFWVAIARNSDR